MYFGVKMNNAAMKSYIHMTPGPYIQIFSRAIDGSQIMIPVRVAQHHLGIIRLHPKPTESETLGAGPSSLF